MKVSMGQRGGNREGVRRDIIARKGEEGGSDSEKTII